MAQVYVEASTMQEWKTSMETINKKCLESIETIEEQLNDLNESLRGDYADSYTESYTSFIKQIKSSHEELRNMETFLDTIVEVMNNS